MSILTWIFGEEAIRRLPAQQKAEIRQKIDQLVHIGKTDDFFCRSCRVALLIISAITGKPAQLAKKSTPWVA